MGLLHKHGRRFVKAGWGKFSLVPEFVLGLDSLGAFDFENQAGCHAFEVCSQRGGNGLGDHVPGVSI